MSTEFIVTLPKEAYSSAAGWPTPAATLPGAKIKQLIVDEKVQPIDNDWHFSAGHLRSRTATYRPTTDAHLTIELHKRLFAVWVPVIAAFGAALITGLFALLAAPSASNRPPIPRRQATLCREALSGIQTADWLKRSPEEMRTEASAIYNVCFPFAVDIENLR